MLAQGSLIIISAPSGTGKTSLVTAICKELPKIRKSISHTTRDMRVGEKNGVHYNFVSREEFANMLAKKSFLEYATVYDNFYGTSKDWVLNTLQQGIDVILEIDWQGAAQVRQQFPEAVSIFILPPSSAILRERLVSRKQDSAQKIALRLKQAKIEVSHYTEYDYLIVNDDFEVALSHLKEIISAARLRILQQKQLWHALITELEEA